MGELATPWCNLNREANSIEQRHLMKAVYVTMTLIVGMTLATRAIALDVDPPAAALQGNSDRRRTNQVCRLGYAWRFDERLGRCFHKAEPECEI